MNWRCLFGHDWEKTTFLRTGHLLWTGLPEYEWSSRCTRCGKTKSEGGYFSALDKPPECMKPKKETHSAHPRSTTVIVVVPTSRGSNETWGEWFFGC